MKILYFFVLTYMLVGCKDNYGHHDINDLEVHIRVLGSHVKKATTSCYAINSQGPGQAATRTISVDQQIFEIETVVKNNGKRPAFIWLMCCSWQENFEINNNYMSFEWEICDKNFADINKIAPGDSIILTGRLRRSPEVDHIPGCYDPGEQVPATALGLVLVDDMYHPVLDNNGYELNHRDKSKWRIVWSNPLYLLDGKKSTEKATVTTTDTVTITVDSLK
jgi:hypothetical protein